MIYGLTGGVGMGKSTVSSLAAKLGARIWDADAETHRLYERDYDLLGFIDQHWSACVTDDYRVDRKILADIVFEDKDALKLLTARVKERLERNVQTFIENTSGLRILDVPLLFEGGFDRFCDETIVVHCSPELQRDRVLARGWSEQRLEKVCSLQWTNEQRFARAQHCIDTSVPMSDIVEMLGAIFAHADTYSCPAD